MHKGVIEGSPFVLTTVIPGRAQILIYAKDRAGNKSTSPAIIKTNFGGRRIGNVILRENHKAQGWPGNIITGSVDGSGYIQAEVEDPQIPDGFAIDYRAVFTAREAISEGSKLALAFDTTENNEQESGGPFGYYDLAFIHDAAPFWKTDSEPFWGADADPFWALTESTSKGDPRWQPWPGQIEVARNERYYFKFYTDHGSRPQGLALLRKLNFKMDVPDLREHFEDVSLPASWYTIPIKEDYRKIVQITGNFQDDGGTATHTRTRKDPSAPQIAAFDKDGNITTASVDITVIGY